jgi:hypothetical protein
MPGLRQMFSSRESPEASGGGLVVRFLTLVNCWLMHDVTLELLAIVQCQAMVAAEQLMEM